MKTKLKMLLLSVTLTLSSSLLADTQDMFNGNAPPKRVTIVNTTVSVMDAQNRLIVTIFKCHKGKDKPSVHKAFIGYQNGKRRDITKFAGEHLKHDGQFMKNLNKRIC